MLAFGLRDDPLLSPPFDMKEASGLRTQAPEHDDRDGQGLHVWLLTSQEGLGVAPSPPNAHCCVDRPRVSRTTCVMRRTLTFGALATAGLLRLDAVRRASRECSGRVDSLTY